MGINTLVSLVEPEVIDWLKLLSKDELRKFLLALLKWPHVDGSLAVDHPCYPGSDEFSVPPPSALDIKKAFAVSKTSARQLLLTVLETPSEDSIQLEQKTKFWAISIFKPSCSTTVTFGKRGTPGTRLTKVHESEAEAVKFFQTMIRNKKREGYRPVKSSILPKLRAEIASCTLPQQPELPEPESKITKVMDQNLAAPGSDVMTPVLQYLKASDFISVSQVCKEWRSMC